MWTLEERNRFSRLYVQNIIDSDIIFGDPGMGIRCLTLRLGCFESQVILYAC